MGSRQAWQQELRLRREKMNASALTSQRQHITKTELEAHIAEALQTMKEAEHILVFCDLLSGSPFNTIVPESMKDRRIKVVYGTNLAMLIETLMERNIGMSWEEILEGIIENGRKQVDFFNEEDLEGCEEENDEDWQ